MNVKSMAVSEKLSEQPMNPVALKAGNKKTMLV